jgi:hypothetical protein
VRVYKIPGHVTFDHRRRQKDRSFSQKTDDLCSGRRVRCCFLCTGRKGKTHGCGEERKGSHHRHPERGRFLRRRLPYRAAAPHVLRNRIDRLLGERVDKKSMMEVLHREHAFSDMFVAYLLTRNIRYEEDLVGVGNILDIGAVLYDFPTWSAKMTNRRAPRTESRSQ